MATTTNQRRRELDREIERYREAATLTLEQLRWVTHCLYQIRKGGLAKALERNRSTIADQARPDR
jgi:hypothetical protein